MKKVKRGILTYAAMFHEEPEGGFTVVVPALQGCVTYGKTFGGRKPMAKEAIEAYLESLAKHGERVPLESQAVSVPVSVPAPINLQLYS